MKSVLISIQQKWCDLIASGEKTLEVRKTRPKLETPFKVYIYCTLSGSNEFFKDALIIRGDQELCWRERRIRLAHFQPENLRQAEGIE